MPEELLHPDATAPSDNQAGASHVAVLDDDRSWHQFKQTYKEELPEILHGPVKAILNQLQIEDDGAPGPAPQPNGQYSGGQHLDSSSPEAGFDERETDRWRRRYGDSVTNERAHLFSQLDSIWSRPPDDTEKPGSGVFSYQWSKSDQQRVDRWDETAAYVDKLPKDAATAEFITDRGYADYIVEALDSYGPFPLSMANKLIQNYHSYTVFEHVDSFPPFDTETAEALINTSSSRHLLENIKRFIGVRADSGLARRIIARDQLQLSDEEAGQLTEYQRNHLVRDRKEKTNTHNVLDYLHQFEELDGDVLKELVSLEYFGGNLVAHKIVDKFYVFKDVPEDALQALRHRTQLPWLTECPREVVDPNTGESRPVSENVRNRWFGEMSYAYLPGGFSKTALGKVIRQRIESGKDATIHDASYWLEDFKIQGSAYDIGAILHDRGHEGFDPDAVVERKLYDPGTEEKFFVRLMDADPALRARLNLSQKDDAAETLFFQPEFQLLYKALMAERDGMPLYKHPEFSFDLFEGVARGMVADFVRGNARGHAKEVTTNTDDEETMQMVIEDFFDTWRQSPAGHAGRISDTMRELRTLAEARRAYIHDTQNWLLKHATSPKNRLTMVWRDRGMALAAGIADNASSLEVWLKDTGLQRLVERMSQTGELQEVYGFTPGEVLGDENSAIRDPLIKTVSAEDTLGAMSKLKRWASERGSEPKMLPADIVPVHLDGAEEGKDEYTVEMLADGDPRGFTIGVETGCCMTVNGKAKSCIEAGYTRPNAGFIAVYPPGKKTAGAQSFWYIHPDYPDVLVLDNIEANAGRDLAKMAEVYRRGLSNYFAAHPETEIRQVNVGTGYTDINLGDLPEAKQPVPRLSETIYTDARNQRVLIAPES